MLAHSLKLSPCWSVLEFWKIKLEKSSSANWIFSQQKSILKLIFAGYTGSKNPVRNRLKIQLVKLDFSKLIFHKSSTNQQGETQYWNQHSLSDFLAESGLHFICNGLQQDFDFFLGMNEISNLCNRECSRLTVNMWASNAQGRRRVYKSGGRGQN